MLLRRPVLCAGLLICGCVPLSGCGSGPTEPDLEAAIASLGQPIQGGYVDETDTAVLGLAILSSGSLGGCSGTLIATNVVLTAQHCVAEVLGGPGGAVICGQTTFGSQHDAGGIFVTSDTEMTFTPSHYHRGAEVLVPPGGNAFCGNDQAILILEEPYDPAEVPPIVPRVDEATVAAEEYSAVGYGQTSDSSSAPSGTRYRRDGLFVDCVGDDCSASSVASSEWRGDTGVCSGDSGGPALDLHGRVTGVASRGAAGCDNPVYGHVQSWGEWIKESTVYAAGLIGADPPAWATGWPTDPGFSHPVGDPCELPEQCPSQICLDGYCTRLCNDQAPCPDGFHCNADSGLCEKDEAPPPPPQGGNGDADEDSGCAIRNGPTAEDPTQPIPWAVGLASLVALCALRRRRRR